MAVLSSLKLVMSKHTREKSPAFIRRQKLLKQVIQQIELAQADADGRVYQCMTTKKAIDPETGERILVDRAKSVKPWWMASGDQCTLVIRYGPKVLNLGKGVNAIELDSKSQLVSALQTVKKAVEAGELDAALEAASIATKRNFKA